MKRYESPKLEKYGKIEDLTEYEEHSDTDGHGGHESHE